MGIFQSLVVRDVADDGDCLMILVGNTPNRQTDRRFRLLDALQRCPAITPSNEPNGVNPFDRDEVLMQLPLGSYQCEYPHVTVAVMQNALSQ